MGRQGGLECGPELMRIRKGDEGPLDPFLAWMLKRAGLQPAAYRSGAMQRRICACLRKLRVSSPCSARELLERKPELLPSVLNTILIGVSEFFRDPPVFDYLEKTVLPELLQTRPRLRVCSAGVSGGQEIYSMAMLLAEAGALNRCELLGVDCRADAIRRGYAGRFYTEDMDGVAPVRRERFFRPVAGRWEVSAELKKQIQWSRQDLLDLDAGGACDLILFRNVAIYFNNRHGDEAWARLCDQLVPDGFIVTGKAERPPASLPLVRVGPSIYRKIAR
ncbi:MAG: methyltransferase, CheR-type [Rariglobus sp.]|nr:methyltransferase, CheR-type [Rariglobus sp.]